MGKGRVRITNNLIAEALGFPPDWIIEQIIPAKGPFGNERLGESEMLISGNDFPEVNNRGDAEDCTLIVHEQQRTFEVKRIEK